MKATIKIIILAVIITVGISSCKKGDTGGKAEIHAKISHHSSPINSSTVYVKFDTQELPANPYQRRQKLRGQTKINSRQTPNCMNANKTALPITAGLSNSGFSASRNVSAFNYLC